MNMSYQYTDYLEIWQFIFFTKVAVKELKDFCIWGLERWDRKEETRD